MYKNVRGQCPYYSIVGGPSQDEFDAATAKLPSKVSLEFIYIGEQGQRRWVYLKLDTVEKGRKYWTLQTRVLGDIWELRYDPSTKFGDITVVEKLMF